MTRKRDTEMDQDLDRMFQAARDHVQPPSDRLMQAILRDAADAMPQPLAAVSARPDRPGLMRRALTGIGGWQSVAVLAVSACFGIWIGYAAPDTADLLDGGFSLTGEAAAVDNTFYTDIDDLLMEG